MENELELIEPERSFEDRHENLCRIWLYYRDFFTITTTLGLIFVGIVIGLMLSEAIIVERSFSDVISSLFPEAVGITFTVLVIDRLNEMRSRKQETRQLLRELLNPDPGISERAAKELVSDNRFQDGSLVGKDLHSVKLSNGQFSYSKLVRTNLSRALCEGANFRRSIMSLANLSFADFRKTSCEGALMDRVNAEQINLESAYLWKTIFRGSHLQDAILRNAILVEADLRQVNLTGADLSGADLTNAKLMGAVLDEVSVSPTTKLPNGRMIDVHRAQEQLDGFSLSIPQ